MTRFPLLPTALLLIAFRPAVPVAAQPGTVLDHHKIADGGFTDGLDDTDLFGEATAALGDLDGDGTPDLAVGAPLDDDGSAGASADRGAVWVLFMNPNGTVREHQKISATQGGLNGEIADGDQFGWSLASVGDLDGDGRAELAVGAGGDDDGGTNRGAVYVLFLTTDGQVASYQKLSDTRGGFGGALDDADEFGRAVAGVGDLDGDGAPDLAAGAPNDDDGGSNRGAVWVLFLNADGSVRDEQKVSDTAGAFTGVLDNSDLFGYAVASPGDLDGNGRAELAVGARGDDDGGSARGAVWVLFLNASGTVGSHQKISDTQGSFTGVLADSDLFGRSVSGIGDLDGDGVAELGVGASYDDDGGAQRGALWELFLEADGTVRVHQKVSSTHGRGPMELDSSDRFGTSVASLGDLDGDGTPEIAVGADGDDDGGFDSGAVWVLFLNADGTVRSHQKISDTAGGFTGILDDQDYFGISVASPGDLDGDGTPDLAVGAIGDDDGGSFRGAAWILFLRADGTVRFHQKISDTEGGFTGTLDDTDLFGSAVASPGDLDGDGTPDLAVGASQDDDGSGNRGAVWVLFLNDNGIVRSHQKISDTEGGFSGILGNGDYFGWSVASLGDVDGDGIADLAIGAPNDDDGGSLRGAVWVLFLNADGTVASHQKISDTEGGFSGPLDDDDLFGWSVASPGDLDGDDVPDLAVGSVWDDDGGVDRGAVYVLFLDGTPTGSPCDIALTDADLSYDAATRRLSVDVTVHNTGPGPAPARLELDYDRDGGAPQGTRTLGTRTLPAGATVSRTIPLRVPAAAPPGDYHFTLRLVDPGTGADCSTYQETIAISAPRLGGGVVSGELFEVEEVVDFSAASASQPASLALSAPYPNPSAGRVALRYEVPAAGRVRLAVYDVLGREVAVLAGGAAEAGAYEAVLDGALLPSGVYVVRLEVEDGSVSRRLMLLRR